ncbi:MAG: prephenate/arogenate dehydrogenase [Cyanobacteria bacterium P01_E01_bin.6]
MKIGIVGLGLIGGSLGLDFRALNKHTVIGVSRRPETCAKAIQRGVVDDAHTDITFVASADVIFICTPIAYIASTVDQLIPHLSSTTILTDVGSVKASIVRTVEPLWPNFVGGHPMAGTAESGIDAALSKLFVDRAYVITPTQKTLPDSIAMIESLARSLHSKTYICTPDDHDRAVAWISHLPVMVSASLIEACLNEPSDDVLTLARTIASSGFRDTSRVGGGNPELGMMMARYNRDEVVRSLKAYQTQLSTITQCIETESWSELEEILQHTQTSRSTFL